MSYHPIAAFSVLFLATMLTYVSAFSAETRESKTQFSHKDWQLVCDNTRTCRAAGYQREEAEDLPVSILITRQAGANTPIKMELSFGTGEGFDVRSTPTSKTPGSMLSNEFLFDDKTPLASRIALLNQMLKAPAIGFQVDRKYWEVSLAGLRSVLLKMDDWQGRVNTPGALVAKGNRPESGVLPPMPAPKIVIAPVLPDASPGKSKTYPKLEQEITQKFRYLDCQLDFENKPFPFSISGLTKDLILVEQQCHMGAYQGASNFWVANERQPHEPKLVLDSITSPDYDQGVVSSSAKGRGLGDCWYSKEWGWTGSKFIMLSASETGLCRGEPGGFWILPTFVSDVTNINKTPARDKKK